MGYSVLIIEDEKNIRDIIKDYFKAEKYHVLEASDGQVGLELFEKNKVDLIILDVMMPKLDGWTVCRRIRKKSDVPIIMLTARTEEDDELMGFELKADDYVKKPFHPKVLVARAKTLLTRNKGNIEDENILKREELEVDILSRTVFLNNEQVIFTQKEFDILVFLMKYEGRVFSREHILERVWGYDYIGETRVVDNHIKKIRKALNDRSYWIRTVFGVGYKFEVS